MPRDVKNVLLHRVFFVVLKRFLCVFFVIFVLLWPLLSIFNTRFDCLNQIDTLNDV